MTEVRVYSPDSLDRKGWRDLQSLQRDAFANVLNKSQAEIDTLVDWHDPERYYESHIDPNNEVGRRFNANQSFSEPQVAVVNEADELVGFAYSAYNVSGKTKAIRNLKQLTIAKNYLWIREVAVKPDHQRQGIARAMGQALLKDASIEQPVAAYIWPDEISFLQNTLNRFHFLPTGEQDVKIFGDDSQPIKQVRYQAIASDIVSALNIAADVVSALDTEVKRDQELL